MSTAVVALLITVFLLAIGIGSAALSQRTAERPVVAIPCVADEATREKIRSILLEATEQALKDHIVRLTESWMKDDTGQPQRAINGATQGIKAFMGSREQALKWNPPNCR